jgi:pimeloyl-ACP methyl ester carboxylesterase
MRTFAGCFPALFLLAACGTHEPASSPPPQPLATTSPATVAADSDPPPAPLPESPATVERVRVPGDSAASLVRGRGGSALRVVFLPGVCSNANAYLQTFPEAAKAHGGVVGIEGDQRCGAENSGYRSFSWDPVRQDARLRAALAAAGVAEDEQRGLTLVGYSAGAAIGELMVQRWPERYARAVLIGAPSDPSVPRLAKAKGVVTMCCSQDVTWRMKGAARRLSAGGVPALYIEMPGCAHGGITEGERVFGEAFDWLDANALH